MSEPLRTYTERCRDQRRIEALEADLADANRQNELLAAGYRDALEALAEAGWHGSGVVLNHALWALAGSMATILAMRWLA